MDTQSNVTSTAELESQLGQIILSIEEVVPQRLRQWLTAFACSNGTTSEMLLCSALVSTSSLLGQTTLRLFWFLRGEGKPSSDRYCPFWNGENTSVPERMRGANRGPCRGENTDQHCDWWNIIKRPIQPFPGRLVFIWHRQELLALIIILGV